MFLLGYAPLCVWLFLLGYAPLCVYIWLLGGRSPGQRGQWSRGRDRRAGRGGDDVLGGDRGQDVGVNCRGGEAGESEQVLLCGPLWVKGRGPLWVKGFLPSVNYLVFFKVRHVTEVFSTLITTIGFLSGVNYLVSFKAGHSREVLSTLITTIGFLPSVNSLVFFKGRHVREVLSTLITTIGFRPSVNSLVETET